MWCDYLFSWPEEIPPLSRVPSLSFEAVAVQLRLQHLLGAQATLLAIPSTITRVDASAWLFLKSYLAIAHHGRSESSEPSELTDVQNTGSCRLGLFLKIQSWLHNPSSSHLPDLTSSFWTRHLTWQPIVASAAAVALVRNDLVSAQYFLDSIDSKPILEIVRQRAYLLARQQRMHESVQLLADAVHRFPQHLKLQAQFVDTLLEARHQHLTLPSLRHALSIHGETPLLLGAVCAVKLLQRQPSLARRAALVQRLTPDLARLDHGRVSNLLVSYEQTGHSDWLPHLSESALLPGMSFLPIMENRCLQLASSQSPEAKSHLLNVASLYQQNPLASPFCSLQKPIDVGSTLRIGWLTADICHHPVARFLLGFFLAMNPRPSHQHVLINTCDHGAESRLDMFESCSNIQHIDATQLDLSDKLRVVRGAECDIAIDLSGWTGGHFLRGFAAGLAPVQVNYLGYFATTGLPNMDAWVGDYNLFPEPMLEWHSEAICRLPRCFIAWQPPLQLDEAALLVTEPPSSPSIQFGCFNHNRKLSDHVLSLWGQLLESIPGSSLVLKANAASDPHTQLLLVRRMRRFGLDPDRVVWLPLASTHRDHLLQYAHMDVALDSFPNGGCTTTCEALWMGVPVITLTGSHYVSRMSTAVLHGAGLGHWCASSPQHYLRLAQEQADHLAELRATRDRWRSQVINNPLGDAADLMHHLEQAFSKLYANKLAAQAL